MRIALIAGLPVCLLIAFAAIAIDSNRLHVREITIRSDVFADIFGDRRIALISDTHFRYEEIGRARRLLAAIEAAQPDLILLTGDYVRWYGRHDDYARAFRFFERLQAPLGVFAVMGDADYSFPRQSCTFCHSRGGAELAGINQVQFLRDAYLEVPVGDRQVRIAGVDCWQDLQPDYSVVDSLAAGQPTILLSHTSLVYHHLRNDREVLVVAGDTHGGQFYLPAFAWKLLQRKPDPEHMHGLFGEGPRLLYVTSGAGTTDLRFRFGVPPEVALLRFVPVSE